MTHPVTGDGLLSLVRDYEGQPKSALVAAAGYIKPSGKLAYTAFYEALMEARGIPLPPEQPYQIPRRAGRGPAIYVACLASYNNGYLYGSWLDLSDGPDASEIHEAIAQIITESPAPGAEEYAIHDCQELPGFLVGNEWPDISELAAYCQNWDELPEDDTTAYRIACTDQRKVLEIREFQDLYCGAYESPSDFAYERYEELLDQIPDALRCHIDWEGVWNDLDADGYSAHFDSDLGRYLIFSS